MRTVGYSVLRQTNVTQACIDDEILGQYNWKPNNGDTEVILLLLL
jgi:hypothetical protein